MLSIEIPAEINRVPKCVAGLMMRDFLKLQCVTDGMYLMPKYVTDGQRENGLGIIGRVVKRHYTLCHRMQWDKRFHVSLASLFADIFPAVRSLPDMMRIEPVYIHIRQTAESRKNKHTPCQFHIAVLRHGVAIRRFSSLRLICFSFGGLFFSYSTSSIGLARMISLSTARYNNLLSQHRHLFILSVLHSKSFNRNVVILAKLFRYFLQRYILHIIHRFYVLSDTVLKDNGLSVGGA